MVMALILCGIFIRTAPLENEEKRQPNQRATVIIIIIRHETWSGVQWAFSFCSRCEDRVRDASGKMKL
jgi:hypothetical protein